MINILFLSVIALSIALLFNWSFRTLQKEKWQILGSVPHHKCDDGAWHGTNFTYYGFFTAVAAAFAGGIGLVLLGSQMIDLTTMLLLSVAILVPCFAAAKIVAGVVEKKEATISIGGASFVGIILSPWLIFGIQHVQGTAIPVVTVLAALSIAYTFGESLGRLACISFGCCYGKRVSEVPDWIGKILRPFSFVFSGDLKKITYAHHMDGEAVIPIQGITSIIYAVTGLTGAYLFMQGYHTPALLLTMSITQVWRLLSEFVRADYRGNGKISVYQWMGGLSVLYVILITFIFPIAGTPSCDITDGLALFWNPGVILFLELLFIFTFVYTGRSQVTRATLTFNVQTHKI